MDHIAIFRSGNHAYRLQGILAKRGLPTDVINTPCKIARNGCGYSLKYNAAYGSAVMAAAKELGLPIFEIFEVIPEFRRNTYRKL